MDKNSLAHTSWNCKYHIVFAPKYRRRVIYGQLKEEIGKILRDLCQRKGIIIHEATACPDHIHMLVSIPPKFSVSEVMGYLKGKSSLIIFERHANLKYKYGSRHFWCRGYFVDTLGFVSHHHTFFFVQCVNLVGTLPFTYTAGDAAICISDYFKLGIDKFYTHFNMHRLLP